MTAEEKRVQEELDLLLTYQMEGMSDDDREAWREYMGLIKDEYKAAAKEARNKELDDKQQKYYDDLKNSIAKSLPSITKGAFDAAVAFKKGDNLAGTAALMDICAAIIPVFTSLAAAGGPEGALVGALFSAVGQILAYFAPKAPSIEQKIKELFDKADAKQNLVKIEAVETSIRRYAGAIKDGSIALHRALSLKITDVKSASLFLERAKAFQEIIKRGEQKMDAPEFASWEVAAWLSLEDNHENKMWPEIMGHWCLAYANLVHSNLILKCLVNKKRVQELQADFAEDNPAGPLAGFPETRHDIWKKLGSLLGMVDSLLSDWKNWSETALGILRETDGNARDRGLYVHAGWHRNGYPYLYAATGRAGFRNGWSPITSGTYWLGDGYLNDFSIIAPKKSPEPLNPQYRLFLPRSHDERLYHATIMADPPAQVRQNEQEVRTGIFSSAWALPNLAAAPTQAGSDPEPCHVYVGKNDGAAGELLMFQLDGKNAVTDSGWRVPAKARVTSVRAVTHPPAALPDDPDRDGLPAGSELLGGTDHAQSIQYAGLQGSPDIMVVVQGRAHHVTSPWSDYRGIAVDDYYLWVFGPTAFACASHASIIKCVNGKTATPRWVGHAPSIVGDLTHPTGNMRWWDLNGNSSQSYPAVQGVISVSPCQDGTVTVCAFTRAYDHDMARSQLVWKGTDTLGLFTADCKVDIGSASITIGSWRRSEVAAGFSVQKMPIPCWSLIQSLKADLRIGGASSVMA